MDDVIGKVGDALLMSARMAWSVSWSLVVGCVHFGFTQAVASQNEMRQALGRDGFKEIALAMALPVRAVPTPPLRSPWSRQVIPPPP